MALLLNANDSVNRSYTITKPSPNHPLTVQGVGELETTGEHAGQYKIPISSGGVTTNIYLGSTQTVRQVKKLVLDGTENWNENLTNYGYRFGLNVSDSMQSDTTDVRSLCTHLPLTVRGGTGLDVQNVYVISASSDLIIKLSNSDRVSDLKTWLAQQYANGTPVTVWYVLAEPTTGIVNEPLMKIGTYTDSLSNAAQIPTTEGANSITVDTIVQPSEFTATWTGWHNATVKEKSENLFDTFDIVGQVPSISNGQLINYNGSTTSLIPIISGNITVTKPPTALLYLLLYAADMSYIGYVQNSTDANFYGSSVTGYENAKYCRLRIDRTTGLDDIQIMLNTGSTALPYEPYWK